jgi:hypothetical protein
MKQLTIREIVSAISNNRIRITHHADEEACSDNLTISEIFMSAIEGEIIESYPNDTPYPSCLIYGKNKNSEPIHSVWAFNEENSWAVLITVYRPDPERWVDWKTRRK